jgi:hypothetical protein
MGWDGMGSKLSIVLHDHLHMREYQTTVPTTNTTKTKVQLKICIEGFVHAHVYQVSIWGINDVSC